MMMNAMQQHRRGHSLGSGNTVGNERDEDLVLFHEMQRRERASDYSSVAQTLQKDPSTLAPPRSKAGSDDIFSSSEWDKNDYDWLLTPPATPLIPSIDHEAVGNGYSLSGVASARSLLKTTSRLGISRSEPPSRAEPTLRIVRGTLGLQQQANATAVLSSSTNSAPRRSLSSNANASLRSSTPSSTVTARPSTPVSQPVARPSTPSSAVTARPSTPVSQPVARPSTPSRSAGAPRVSSSSTSTSVRSSTPTGRSSTIPYNRSASSTGPSATISSTRPASSSASMPSNRPASSFMPSAMITSTRPGNSSMPSATVAPTRPGSSSSRASTPVKRPATPTRTANLPSASIRSSSVSKASTVPASKTAALSRPSSPASRVQQLAAHPAVLPGFSQEPPPNLRTSMPDRPLSNSRGSVASRAGGPSRSTQPEVANDGARNMRLSSSPLVSRGRISSDSLNGDKSISRNGRSHDALPALLSNGINSKMVDRNVPAKKPLALSEKLVSSQQVKKPIKSPPARDVKSTVPAVRESSGFGRNLSRKSLDMALRHMDIRKNTPSGYKSFMSNVPASSLYSVRSSNGRGLSISSVADSPMATSSNASSEEHSMSIVIDQEGSELGDEMLSEKGSKASPISQPDSYNERRVNSWLGSPHYTNGNNTDILQVFEQGIERLSSTESPLISQYEGTIECDNFTLEPIQ